MIVENDLQLIAVTIAGSLLGVLYLFVRDPVMHPGDPWKKRIVRAAFPLLVSPFAVMFALSFGIQEVTLALFVGLTFPLALSAITTRSAFENKRADELRATLSKAEAAIEREPDKVRPVWDLSRVQLELYITRNLAQVRNIFWITVAVMAAGFGLVVYGIYRAFDSRLEVAILTAATGVITQTIGATFLLIYRSTMSQANDYVDTLERINAVGMAVQIVDLIPDENKELKNKARVDLVKLILALPKKATPPSH
jgi:hypothetical protein